VVVESGVIAMPDGVELRRGTLVGPVGDGSPGMVAQTRTPVRLWVIPDASDLPPLVGATHRPPTSSPAVPGRTAPSSGVHPTGVYPPLAVPPGPPEGTEDPNVDRRFERRMWWLVLLVLLLALLLTAVNFRPGPAWAEMATNRVLLSVDDGLVYARIDNERVAIDEGERRYVAEGTQIEIPSRSVGRLTFQGGAAALLCGGADLKVGRLWTEGGRERVPSGTLIVDNGRVLADTTSVSGAYRPLALVVSRPTGDVTNAGAAWYSADPAAVTVSSGRVTVGGAQANATGSPLTCGDGIEVEPPSAGPSDPPSEVPSDLPSEITPSVIESTVPPTTEVPVTPTTTPDPDDDQDEPDDPPATTVRPPTTTTRQPAPSPSPSRQSPRPSPSPSPSPPAPSDDNDPSPPIIIGRN
jgi:putative peptide zinc metalloprotease protein